MSMGNESKRSTFDKLVAGLSTEDRLIMLSNLSKDSAPAVQFVESDEPAPEKNYTLRLRYREESVFYKFILWLRSVFQKKDSEKLYNEDIIAAMARKLSRNHPGLIFHRDFVMDQVFYELLRALKDVADFFKPYFSFIDENPGDFYVYLSSFVTPELSDKINNTADPFILDFQEDPTIETKNKLLKTLDSILNEIDGSDKAELYNAVQSVNWLKNLIRIPYIHFLAQFTNLTGSYTCPYRNAVQDFNYVAAVFTNIHPVQTEVLDAIFLFSKRKEITKNAQEKDIERAVKEFISLSNTHFSTVQQFISSVPVVKLGKILNGDYDWLPGNTDGVEAWFPSFRSQWRKIIEIRWNEWLRERKKSILSTSLLNDFKLSVFPEMKYKPWADLWSRVPFSCELTGGYMSWFASDYFDKISERLNEVMMEGIFIKSENRIEYSEGLNCIVQACARMNELNARLSPSGEYGQKFEDFIMNKIRSFQVQNQIDSMMAATESEIHECIKDFCKGAKMVERVMHGFFDETKDGIHETLQNFTTIKGRNNRDWREGLAFARDVLRRSVYYISELEPIDQATANE